MVASAANEIHALTGFFAVLHSVGRSHVSSLREIPAP